MSAQDIISTRPLSTRSASVSSAQARITPSASRAWRGSSGCSSMQVEARSDVFCGSFHRPSGYLTLDGCVKNPDDH